MGGFKAKYIVEAKGLGDTISNITLVTGISKAVEIVSDKLGIEDCGCNKRKNKLNELFPYKENINANSNS